MKRTAQRLGGLALLAAAIFTGPSLSHGAGAEEFSYTISGRVIRNGQSVSGASVSATGAFSTAPRGTRLRVQSQDDGSFAIGGLNPGSYVLRASKQGEGTGRAVAQVGSVSRIGSARRIIIRLR